MPSPTGAQVWRDSVTDGVPSSGAHKPKKSEIRQWSNWIESLMTASGLAGAVWKTTRSALNADLDHAANKVGVVYSDTTASNNGLYLKSGSSGSGSWTQLTTFLPGYQFASGTDSGAGTSNAIQVTTDLPATDGLLVAFTLFRSTTASPVTVRIDGGATLTIKTVLGANVSSLIAGQEVWGRIRYNDNTFRLISDQDMLLLVQETLADMQETLTAAQAQAALAAGYAQDAEAEADAAAASASTALTLVTAAAAGFTGFDEGNAYDFGSVTESTTYFDQDWGSITDPVTP